MDKLYTRKQAAERLGISLVTLDQLRTDRLLAYIQHKPGSKVMIPEKAIEAYLEKASHPARPERQIGPTLRKIRGSPALGRR